MTNAYWPAMEHILARRPRLQGKATKPPLWHHLKHVNFRNPALVMALIRRQREHLLIHTAYLEQQGTSALYVGRLWSQFADEAVKLADRCAYSMIALQHAYPCTKQGTPVERSIIAMGKWGSFELNPSSDIDLIFVFDEANDHAEAEHFFTLWARKCRMLLSETTEHGFAFRVDTDLRPWGNQGPLVIGFPALQDYFQNTARMWERAAYVRARLVLETGLFHNKLHSLITTFVFDHPSQNELLTSLYTMKNMVTRGASLDGFDVKRGRGGIREVEFIVQSMQLIYGITHPSMQHGTILELLQRGERLGLYTSQTARELGFAYGFLRRLEHALQYEDDQQTQWLPEQGITWERISHYMGASTTPWNHTPQLFSQVLIEVRARVHQRFQRLLGEQRQQPQESSQRLSLYLLSHFASTTIHPHDMINLLKTQFQFAPTTHTWNLLFRLAHSIQHSHAHTHEPSILPTHELTVISSNETYTLLTLARWLDCILDAPDPMRALTGLSELLQESAPPWIQNLHEDPQGSALLLRILSVSPALSRMLWHQHTLEEIIFRGATAGRHSTRRMQQQLLDTHNQTLSVRWFYERHMLAASMAFIAQPTVLPIMQRRMSHVMDVIVHDALQRAQKEIENKFGLQPSVNIAILALGSWGAREWCFLRDIDCLFIMQEEDVHHHDSSLSPQEWTERVARRCIQLLSTDDEYGVHITVDTRLRPDGHKGALCIPYETFVQYHQKSSLWENQAMLRLRHSAGSQSLSRRIIQNMYQLLQTREHLNIGKYIQDMRVRMIAERTANKGIDIKLGEGGVVDFEFAIQALQLKHCHRYPRLLNSSTHRVLKELARHQIISTTWLSTVLPAVQRLQLLREWLMFMDDGRSSTITPDDERLQLCVESGMWTGSPLSLYQTVLSDCSQISEFAHRVWLRT